MYSRTERIRFSEVGPDGKLTLPALVNYFQDCSTFHSEDLGVGLSYLQERNCAWLMSFWQVTVEEYPELGEEVRIETRPYAFEHFMGKRNFELFSASGRSLARADSLWFYYNAGTERPERPPAEMIEIYGMDERITMDYAGSRKIPLPDQMEAREPFSVRRIQLDTNGHVNNGQYVRMAEEYFPEGKVTEFRMEYKKAARLGDRIYPKVGRQDGWTVAALCDEKGRPYAVAAVQGNFSEVERG
ncbi:thioesterase [Cuneatibacter sp. NSJ-177]|uniref:acyl-[acyl-carrier-protein] thioesterase n=1 Tax=Cuneatibacter sp. NSJ-177 TaxID=2931401 RepID=UPI001FD12A3C|nr:acyl-ACP thioesterase domain-containing protein [Cuneatibacter sp. NSJ-177]MCJ7837271.1 thioesterase [Cuneatibacter sp. NSJ-177]